MSKSRATRTSSRPSTSCTHASRRRYLKSFDAAQIDGSESRQIVLKMRVGPIEFTGQSYLLNFVLPNFFFHVTTAYDILRHSGVELGKLDYLGGRDLHA
ncbi:PF09351 domain protein [Burkholderia metallica]|nr:PF09351 domain protein [Burkholderia metallica]